MTLDAWSHPTLADVKRGECCGVSKNSFISLVTNRSGRIVHCVMRAPGSLTTRYVGHSRVKGEGLFQTVVMVTPKDLLVTCGKLTTRVLQNIL